MHTLNQQPSRLAALDVLRGLTIIGMLIVNNPGSWSYIYAPLKHAEWNGLTPKDLVFPFFMFIMGVSTYISLRKFQFAWSSELAKKVIKRTVLLFGIGLALNWIGQGMCSIQSIRIMGVLQRLAVCYFFAIVIGTSVSLKKLPFIIATILIGYFILLLVGNGFEYGPGNILSIVDRSVLGGTHIYRDNGIEPEGLLSTLPAIAHTLIGYYIGNICLQKTDINMKLQKLFIIGSILLFSGYLLSYGCPINKKVWSPTFVLVTCGAATLLLSLLIWSIDIKKLFRSDNVFTAFGVNPLFCYVAGQCLAISLIYVKIGESSLHTLYYQNFLSAIFGENCFSSLLMAISIVTVIGIIGYALYRKRIYIRI